MRPAIDHISTGRWRTPSNRGVARPGSVQERRTARRRNYRDATVAGAVHLEQFVPLLLDAFGDAWWWQGTLSVHCVSATVEGEPVRCYLERGSARRARVWMNAEGEALVLRGTASLGDDPCSELRARLAHIRPAPRPRLLAGIAAGDTVAPRPVRIGTAQVNDRLGTVTEPVRCYRDPAPFAGRVVPPSLMVRAMRPVEDELAPPASRRLGVFGGLEICYRNGPVMCDRDYRLCGRVLAVSASRHTEILWHRADLTDADERVVASLVRMDRFAA